MTDERKDVAEELRRVREEVRRQASLAPERGAALPPLPEVREGQPLPRVEAPAPEPPPTPPDASPVNAAWRAEAARPRGLAGFVYGLLERILRPRFEAQQAFNARQVQLDNETLAYLGERFAATHRHYDRILGLYGRHLGEIDERHLILQEELVAHVHALVTRIDLVLAEAERGGLSLEHELRDVRGRLQRLEEALQGR